MKEIQKDILNNIQKSMRMVFLKHARVDQVQGSIDTLKNLFERKKFLRDLGLKNIVDEKTK
jgi:hypothetical protein